jgi:plastocyanin
MRLLAAFALLAACSAPPPPHESQTVHVEIRGMQFAPAALHVERGDVVVFTNHDIVPHTATSAGWFDSGPINSGQSWSYVVTEAINYQYVCSFHPTMHGELLAQHRAP